MRLLRSALRILLAVAICIALLFLGAMALMRQPVLTRERTSLLDHADPARLRAHVQFLASRMRSSDHPDELNIVAAYIARHFRASGAIVEEQAFREYRNVIAHFGPTDPKLPVLVIGAHYDAFGDLPGADDNASGTAAILELARLLGRTPPNTPVMLVAFTTEEPPFFGSELMGSAVHAESLKRPVIGMMSLEMIGYFRGDQRWTSWVLSLMYPKKGDFIAACGGWRDRVLARRTKRALNASGIRAVSFTGPRTMLDASDHRNYWSRGWPAVIVTDTAYVRNPNYHTARDTADTLDYARMARVVDGVFRVALSPS